VFQSTVHDEEAISEEVTGDTAAVTEVNLEGATADTTTTTQGMTDIATKEGTTSITTDTTMATEVAAEEDTAHRIPSSPKINNSSSNSSLKLLNETGEVVLRPIFV